MVHRRHISFFVSWDLQDQPCVPVCKPHGLLEQTRSSRSVDRAPTGTRRTQKSRMPSAPASGEGPRGPGHPWILRPWGSTRAPGSSSLLRSPVTQPGGEDRRGGRVPGVPLLAGLRSGRLSLRKGGLRSLRPGIAKGPKRKSFPVLSGKGPGRAGDR